MNVKTHRTRAFIQRPGKREVLVMIRVYPGDGPTSRVLMLPGGGIDEGESPEEALKRECGEELGLKLRNLRLVHVLNATRPLVPEEKVYWPKADTVTNMFEFYSADIGAFDQVTLLEPEKFERFDWVLPIQIASYAKKHKAILSDGVIQAVVAHVSGGAASVFSTGWK